PHGPAEEVAHDAREDRGDGAHEQTRILRQGPAHARAVAVILELGALDLRARDRHVRALAAVASAPPLLPAEHELFLPLPAHLHLADRAHARRSGATVRGRHDARPPVPPRARVGEGGPDVVARSREVALHHVDPLGPDKELEPDLAHAKPHGAHTLAMT